MASSRALYTRNTKLNGKYSSPPAPSSGMCVVGAARSAAEVARREGSRLASSSREEPRVILSWRGSWLVLNELKQSGLFSDADLAIATFRSFSLSNVPLLSLSLSRPSPAHPLPPCGGAFSERVNAGGCERATFAEARVTQMNVFSLPGRLFIYI
jgi:hypothetical protein